MRTSKKTLKLFPQFIAAYCGKNVQGESGTSRNKTSIYYYYKCVGRKQYAICNSKVYGKDDLENFITDATLHLFDNPEIVEKIADGVMEVNKKRLHDKSLKKVLIEERDKYKNR